MESAGGDDGEAAFLKAMQDQHEDYSLDPVADSSTNTNQEENSPPIHPDDVLRVDYDDDNGEEDETLPISDESTTALQPTTANIAQKASGQPAETETSEPGALAPATGSSTGPSNAIAEVVPESTTEQDDAELTGPFVIEQDDEASAVSIPNDNRTATLPFQESPDVIEKISQAGSALQPTTMPPVNVNDDAPVPSVIKKPSAAADSVPAPLTQQQKKKRLAQDVAGILEDRISQDSRGDVDAWLQLINYHQKKGKIEDARAVYERFFAQFPTSAEQWMAYAQMELDANNLADAERVFTRCLLNVPNVELWSMYLDYIRRRNNLVTDTDGKARTIITQVYEFVLQNIGIDKESGKIWQDYIAFIKSGPGSIGGSAWQDQQKMDSLRKVYQRAICIPVNGVEAMWKEYDQFEMGLNKTTGRKFISEKSPSYMTARSSLASLRNTINGLNRTTLPRLPPVPGFEGYEELGQQQELWKKWVEWEKNDPLVLAQEPNPEDIPGYQNRVLFVYKQALMAMRFWPEMWFEACEFCFSIGKDKEGVEMLVQGMKANPESCLLHFRYSEYLESSVPAPNPDDKAAVKKRSGPIREIYDRILDVYYGILSKAHEREQENLARLEEEARKARPVNQDDDDDDYEPAADPQLKNRIAALKEASKNEALSIMKIISAIWINLMRTMRRIEGHGKVNDVVGGSRQIFADARKRGKITSDVFVASALMEYHCYKDPAASRIFDRGLKVYPEDEDYVLEYLKHLISTNDLTNARAVFETFVGRFTADRAGSAKRVYQFFYDYESQYGDFEQIQKLEKRLRELFPQDPKLKLFQGRHSYQTVNPSLFAPIVSGTQIRPKGTRVEPRPLPAPERSPKRQADDSDGDVAKNERPRKIQRGESPIKGAAGRRLMDQKRAAAAAAAAANKEKQEPHHAKHPSLSVSAPQPAPLPDSIVYLLSRLPPAQAYRAVRFNPEEMHKLLMSISVPPPPANHHNGVSHFSQPFFSGLVQKIAANQRNMSYFPVSQTRYHPYAVQTTADSGNDDFEEKLKDIFNAFATAPNVRPIAPPVTPTVSLGNADGFISGVFGIEKFMVPPSNKPVPTDSQALASYNRLLTILQNSRKSTSH